jgi:hypothetical protein
LPDAPHAHAILLSTAETEYNKVVTGETCSDHWEYVNGTHTSISNKKDTNLFINPPLNLRFVYYPNIDKKELKLKSKKGAVFKRQFFSDSRGN